MNREIKFRVWCKQQEEMNMVEKMRFLDDGSFWCAEDKDKDLQPPYFYDDDDFELMQFTGLHDKNGVPIYEGDIIRIYNDEIEEEDSWVDEVSWHIGGFFSGDEDLLHNLYFRSKVIGNIYENENLLKRKDGN